MQNLLSIKLIIIIIISIWFLGILSPLYLNYNDLDFYFILKMIYDPICHQNPDKCIIYNNLHLLVCSRCFGIYSGMIAISIIILFSNKIYIHKKFLAISVFPIILDVIVYNLKIYSYNKTTAFVTGFIFGAILLLFIFTTLKEFFKN